MPAQRRKGPGAVETAKEGGMTKPHTLGAVAAAAALLGLLPTTTLAVTGGTGAYDA
jgi:hypothetical protein